MPVQSEKVATIRKNYSIDPQKPETLILIEGGKIFTKSEAVLRIFKKIGFPWNLLWVLIIIPGFIRNPVYSLIAKKRFLWFGRRDSCFMPDNEKQAEMN